MSDDTSCPNLDEAANRYLSELSTGNKELCQQEIYRFIRWYGRTRSFTELTAPEVGKYTDQFSSSDTDYTVKLKHVRAFLSYAKKQGWSQTNLSTHLKVKKAETKVQNTARQNSRDTISLTKQGLAELENELIELKTRSNELVDEIRKAAADKDFRENAPLHAAREQRGHIEGRIKELEETLKLAVVIDDNNKQVTKIGVGDSVILHDLNSGRETRYMIVSPREVDPAMGKISNVSPIGKAITGRNDGEVIEVAVPAGKMRYKIQKASS